MGLDERVKGFDPAEVDLGEEDLDHAVDLTLCLRCPQPRERLFDLGRRHRRRPIAPESTLHRV